MKTVNTIISENIYNAETINHIVAVCKSVAENNGVRAEFENNEIFIYEWEQKDIDPTDVRTEMLQALTSEGF